MPKSKAKTSDIEISIVQTALLIDGQEHLDKKTEPMYFPHILKAFN